jgi:hypothetical protein
MSMEQKQEGSAGEMMIVGLIDHADRIGKSAQSTQHALTEQIQKLAQLHQWTVNAAVDLQKRSDVVIQKIEAERAQLQGTRAGLERSAAQAIQNAVRQQSTEIERQVVQALATPLRDIQQSADRVRQNIKDSNWLFITCIFVAGVMIGLFAGYIFVIRTQNTMNDRLNRVEQFMPVSAQPVSTTPDTHAPAPHKGKAK